MRPFHFVPPHLLSSFLFTSILPTSLLNAACSLFCVVALAAPLLAGQSGLCEPAAVQQPAAHSLTIQRTHQHTAAPPPPAALYTHYALHTRPLCSPQPMSQTTTTSQPQLHPARVSPISPLAAVDAAPAPRPFHMHLSSTRPAGRELGDRELDRATAHHASDRMEQQPQTSTAGRLTAPAAAAQRTGPLAPPAPRLSPAHTSSSREGALNREAAAAPSPAAVRIPIPARPAAPAAATTGESSVSAAPAAAPVKTEGQKTAAAPKQSGSRAGGHAASPATAATGGSAGGSGGGVPLNMPARLIRSLAPAALGSHDAGLPRRAGCRVAGATAGGGAGA